MMIRLTRGIRLESPRAREARWALQEQLRLIERYRRRLCRERGVEVSAEDAAADWIGRFAARWRSHWERRPLATKVQERCPSGGWRAVRIADS